MGLEDLIAKQMGNKIVPEGEEPTPEVEPKAEGTPQEGPNNPGGEGKDQPLEDKKPQPSNDEPSKGDNQPQSASFDDLLIEKSGGKFKTYDEVVNALESTSKENGPQFANEQLVKLNEYVSQGGDLKTFVETQLKDFASYDEMGIIKEKMMMDDPDLTLEEVNLILEDKFKLDEDEYSESEIKLSKVKLRKEARQAREFFEKFQKDNAIPAGVKDREVEQRVNHEKMEQQQRDWESTLSNQLNELSHVEFSLGGDETFKFEITDEIKSEVKNSVTFINDFWKRYFNEGGEVDYPKFFRDMTRVVAGDKLDAFIASQARSQGRQEFSEELDNPDYTPSGKGGAAQTQATVRSQIWKELNK